MGAATARESLGTLILRPSIARVLIAAFVLIVASAGAAAAAPGKSDLATVIQKRLNQAGDLTFPVPLSDGGGGGIQPQRAFEVYASLNGMKPFTFEVDVYKTAAQAATEYAQAITQVHSLGGDFRDYKIIRSGRVLYMGFTAGQPDLNVPPVPVKDFLRLIAIAKASL